MTDLTDYLTEAPDGIDLTDEQVRERWRIDNDELATWAGRKLAAAQNEQARIKAIAQTEKDRIDAWAADAARSSDSDVSFFTARLVEYRRQLEDSDPKLPGTYKLPTVALKRTAGRLSVKVLDEAAFIAWATENCPDAVKVTRAPLVSGLAGLARKDDGQIVSEDGEVVPGVEERRADDSYTVKPVDLWLGEPF